MVSGEVERMFEECHSLVFRTAYRITGNTADAEDVLQAVFLRLLRRDRAAEPVDNPESYLRRAAINAALDIVRARDEKRDVPLQETVLTSGDGGEVKDCVRTALSRLQPRSAEIFALRFFEGYTNPEIARLLGISQVHVGVVLHRTRKQLQKEVRLYMGGKR